MMGRQEIGEELFHEFRLEDHAPADHPLRKIDRLLDLSELRLDDYSAFVDITLRRLPGVTKIRSNLSLKEMKASSKLPVLARRRQ